jgi:uncharacterized protein YndB with AHSA1/START domain
MITKNRLVKKIPTFSLTVSRVIKAPCALVFQAWTDPGQMAKWWSPEDIECQSFSADIKPGGALRVHMVSKKGEHIAIGTYKKVVTNKTLQFTFQWENYAMPHSIVTVQFEDLGESTRLTLIHQGLPDLADARDHKKGWTSMVKKFAEFIEQDKIKTSAPAKKIAPGKNKVGKDYGGHEFLITYEFNAPRELVFQAWTEPEHIAQWWGPRGFTNPVCQWDPRPGKKIYVVMRAPNGTDYPMGGEFREIWPPERLVFTSGALDEKKKLLFEFLHTATFAERNGKTKLTLRSRVIRTSAGAGRYIGGFEAGMTQSLERLAELLTAKNNPLIVERTFNAPVERVWKAISTREEIGEWSFDMKKFKAEIGFKFEFYAGKDDVKYLHRCQVTEVIPHKKLAYTWRYEGHPGNSLVTIELFAEGKKTHLKLTHTGLETFPQTADFKRSNFVAGWNMLLGTHLKKFVETKGK